MIELIAKKQFYQKVYKGQHSFYFNTESKIKICTVFPARDIQTSWSIKCNIGVIIQITISTWYG